MLASDDDAPDEPADAVLSVLVNPGGGPPYGPLCGRVQPGAGRVVGGPVPHLARRAHHRAGRAVRPPGRLDQQHRVLLPLPRHRPGDHVAGPHRDIR